MPHEVLDGANAVAVAAANSDPDANFNWRPFLLRNWNAVVPANNFGCRASNADSASASASVSDSGHEPRYGSSRAGTVSVSSSSSSSSNSNSNSNCDSSSRRQEYHNGRAAFKMIKVAACRDSETPTKRRYRKERVATEERQQFRRFIQLALIGSMGADGVNGAAGTRN
ncbi:hypothetical protein ACLKA7_016981 [Drosophila subpalustris]